MDFLEKNADELEFLRKNLLTATSEKEASVRAEKYCQKKQTCLTLISARLEIEQDFSEIDENIWNSYHRMLYGINQNDSIDFEFIYLKEVLKEITQFNTDVLADHFQEKADKEIDIMRSGALSIGILSETRSNYINWSGGVNCEIRSKYYSIFPDSFFDYVCKKMNWVD